MPATVAAAIKTRNLFKLMLAASLETVTHGANSTYDLTEGDHVTEMCRRFTYDYAMRDSAISPQVAVSAREQTVASAIRLPS